jgi:polyhydroxybutyrate depolymerase
MSEAVDDVQFARDLIATLKQDYCVDPGRIYATGRSNGAFIASRLACGASGEIAASSGAHFAARAA